VRGSRGDLEDWLRPVRSTREMRIEQAGRSDRRSTIQGCRNMRIKALAILLAVALAGCATSTGAPMSESPAGNTAVAVVGSPFLLVFKTATCALTLAVAAPAAGILALGVDPYGEGFDYLGSGVAHNCGPPYLLSSSAG
jgi:hypothetical protein